MTKSRRRATDGHFFDYNMSPGISLVPKRRLDLPNAEHATRHDTCYAAADCSAPRDQISIRFRSMMEKSHILKSPFIHLYVSPTNFDTETCFCQNNQFLTVAASIFDSIFLMSSHAYSMPCRAGAETKQSQRVWEML